MYDPTIGRFLEEDPIGFAGGDPNLYRYVGNNVTNATDPSGTYIYFNDESTAKSWADFLNRQYAGVDAQVVGDMTTAGVYKLTASADAPVRLLANYNDGYDRYRGWDGAISRSIVSADHHILGRDEDYIEPWDLTQSSPDAAGPPAASPSAPPPAQVARPAQSAAGAQGPLGGVSTILQSGLRVLVGPGVYDPARVFADQLLGQLRPQPEIGVDPRFQELPQHVGLPLGPPPRPNSDYISLTVNIGGFISWSPNITIDRYGDVYITPIGVSFGRALGPFAPSLTAGTLSQQNYVPTPTQMNNFLTGVSGNVSGGAVIGNGISVSPFSGGPSYQALEIGAFWPQIGASLHYQPDVGSFHFGTGLGW